MKWIILVTALLSLEVVGITIEYRDNLDGKMCSIEVRNNSNTGDSDPTLILPSSISCPRITIDSGILNFRGVPIPRENLVALAQSRNGDSISLDELFLEAIRLLPLPDTTDNDQEIDNDKVTTITPTIFEFDSLDRECATILQHADKTRELIVPRRCSVIPQHLVTGGKWPEAAGDRLQEAAGDRLQEAAGDRLQEAAGDRLQEAAGDRLQATGCRLQPAGGRLKLMAKRRYSKKPPKSKTASPPPQDSTFSCANINQTTNPNCPSTFWMGSVNDVEFEDNAEDPEKSGDYVGYVFASPLYPSLSDFLPYSAFLRTIIGNSHNQKESPITAKPIAAFTHAPCDSDVEEVHLCNKVHICLYIDPQSQFTLALIIIGTYVE